MKTIRQLLRVRSFVLATALASLLLLAAMATPASAQGSPMGIFVTNRLLSLDVGVGPDGSPAVIATEYGIYSTSFPAISHPTVYAGLNDSSIQKMLFTSNVAISSSPTIIMINWVIPLNALGRGTHTLVFGGEGLVGGYPPGVGPSSADHTQFTMSITVTVP